MNREAWLTEAARELESRYFNAKGYKIPKYRITCGWPCAKALANSGRRIGECHTSQSSGDGAFEIFVSPTLDKPPVIVGVVMHELIHAAVGTNEGHKGRFIKAMKCLRMGGRPTQALPNAGLAESIQKFVLPKLGLYPHKALLPQGKTVKKSSGVSLKCPTCGCVIRISEAWLERAGSPMCQCGVAFVDKEQDDG